MRNRILSLIVAAVLCSSSYGQEPKFEPNYDESRIPEYTLPDVLSGVESADQWPAKRAEWRELIANEMFGIVPESAKPEKAEIVKVLPDKSILGGQAFFRQFILELAGKTLNVIAFLPANSGEEPVPVFLGYNFSGIHTVFDDPDIILTDSWMRKTEDHKAHAEDRGTSASRWSIERITDAGFGLVTLYYGDVDPDFDDGFHNGVHEKLGVPAANEAASIATWAWALSRVLDVLETSVDEIDASRVAVFGHSRLGKTSLWAGASDERFALVISNNSGCGGAALSRRRIGETVRRINDSFPHWFCGNFKKYGNNEDTMPFDNHTLLSLIAPRPLYVASAEEDVWADPKGEFLSCVFADPVYKLLGTEGIPTKEMPRIDEPVHGRIGYHIRSGKHDVTDYDWEQYVKFAATHLAD